ncbi:hypothetical protein SB749_19140, partial [Brevibacterium sp. SIMBA_078]|uniref:hypothetical protein n=1 Tax=Brevibacterium sp. SIMBA_078 TaxID=3085816 RepID=UPI00397E1883
CPELLAVLSLHLSVGVGVLGLTMSSLLSLPEPLPEPPHAINEVVKKIVKRVKPRFLFTRGYGI